MRSTPYHGNSANSVILYRLPHLFGKPDDSLPACPTDRVLRHEGQIVDAPSLSTVSHVRTVSKSVCAADKL
jgi:hypothetical protein